MAGIAQIADINLALLLNDHFFTGNGQHRALKSLSAARIHCQKGAIRERQLTERPVHTAHCLKVPKVDI